MSNEIKEQAKKWYAYLPFFVVQKVCITNWETNGQLWMNCIFKFILVRSSFTDSVYPLLESQVDWVFFYSVCKLSFTICLFFYYFVEMTNFLVNFSDRDFSVFIIPAYCVLARLYVCSYIFTSNKRNFPEEYITRFLSVYKVSTDNGLNVQCHLLLLSL